MSIIRPEFMKPSSNIITSEGYPYIAYSIGLFLFLAAGAYYLSSIALAFPAFITLLLSIFIVSFFRNPERNTPDDENLVISPADGVIVYTGSSTQEYLGGDCIKISIFMSVFNVHVNRVPFSGTVIEKFYKKGKFYDVRNPKSSIENEQSGLVIETKTGIRLVCVQIAGLIARRIHCYVEPSDQLVCGERYGMIRFGSRLDVYLPLDINILVKHGQPTVAGETPIASFGQSAVRAQ